jgi:hypothetical protein
VEGIRVRAPFEFVRSIGHICQPPRRYLLLLLAGADLVAKKLDQVTGVIFNNDVRSLIAFCGIRPKEYFDLPFLEHGHGPFKVVYDSSRFN